MRQVLIDIPLDWLRAGWHIPIYGYGLMLFLAYLLCTELARRMCKKEGVDGTLMKDLALWLFVFGILGGRALFVIQYWNDPRMGFADRPWGDIFKLWDGGLVLYGALVGGALGYFAYDYVVFRRFNVSRWKMLDVAAPCLALGVALGRIGCLFTGCCYGNVACEHAPPLHFPAYSGAWGKMVQQGYQSPFGFLVSNSWEVDAVESGSAAEAAGLKQGDIVRKVNDVDAKDAYLLPANDGVMKLTVLRQGNEVDIAFAPTSIGVNPTQVFETISMVLLMLFLLSYHPFKRHDGELMVFFMVAYAAHRYLNEMLRTDTDPVAFGLTMSQNISIAAFIAAAVLAFFVWRRPSLGARTGDEVLPPNPETVAVGAEPTPKYVGVPPSSGDSIRPA